jgi:hypothetical protein
MTPTSGCNIPTQLADSDEFPSDLLSRSWSAIDRLVRSKAGVLVKAQERNQLTLMEMPAALELLARNIEHHRLRVTYLLHRRESTARRNGKADLSMQPRELSITPVHRGSAYLCR